MYSKHAQIFKDIVAWIRFRSNVTKITWIKGHSGIRGNDKADKLAADSSQKDMPQEDPFPIAPSNMIPSGTKLSTLSQKDFYQGVKKANPPPPRQRLENILGRINACAEEYYENSPTNELIWGSTKHKDLTKKTQEFLWKCMHDAFKIGKFWENVPNFEHRGTCAHCDVEESMEHILTQCDTPGRTIVWALADELWRKRSQTEIPTNYGAVSGAPHRRWLHPARR